MMSRLQVEQLLNDAVASGQFDQLEGAGRPLDIDPSVDLMQQKLRNMGYVPREVELRKKLANLPDNDQNRAAREHLVIEIDILTQIRLKRI